ncbi:UNVERIFIED_CONTAM: arginine decarboxylase [Brevibacillus sp. OAP136]
MGHRTDAFWERQKRTPLYDALVAHQKSRPHSFHVPGHKFGASFDEVGRHRFADLLALDVTEITGMDDLHQPEGVIAEAQTLAAEAFGADETRFLVGGSTAGNIALIMAVCKPGDKIVVQRNCHKSVYHGLMLARANPIFIVPAVDPDTGVAAGLRREDVERALQAHPDAKAVFLTNPTYYGMGIDLVKMAATVHRHDIPLLVDEAHGAHYGFHSALPPSAMQCGADAAVQSTHKMATSMTMSSMVHIKGTRINRQRLNRALAMIQSSSPSYVLMASLDLARRHTMLEMGKEIDRVLPRMTWLQERLQDVPWLFVPAMTDHYVYATRDPLKLLLSLRTSDLNGYQLQTQFENCGVFPEFAQLTHVLLAASTGTRDEDVEQVLKSVEAMSARPLRVEHEWTQPGVLASSFLREQVIAMHEAVDRPRELIALEDAQGHICAEMVIPYPPGIPLLVPGERIDEQVLQLISKLRDGGARFHGVNDPSLASIEIIA